MYPGFIPHWRRQRCGESRVGEGYGGGEGRGWRRAWAYEMAGEDDPGPYGFGGGAFGVRRPLRYLAYKLQLEEAQVAELAKILDEIKTERAQAAVDQRRTLSAFADAISSEAFDRGKAEGAAKLRLESADRLRGAVVTALGRLHELLNAEQRQRLAYLIRTGTLTI
ncbi:MAG TPA: Spy/CpxP family protein refolding chaperone [Thermoanaerobaculia bacterium]